MWHAGRDVGECCEPRIVEGRVGCFRLRGPRLACRANEGKQQSQECTNMQKEQGDGALPGVEWAEACAGRRFPKVQC